MSQLEHAPNGYFAIRIHVLHQSGNLSRMKNKGWIRTKTLNRSASHVELTANGMKKLNLTREAWHHAQKEVESLFLNESLEYLKTMALSLQESSGGLLRDLR